MKNTSIITVAATSLFLLLTTFGTVAAQKRTAILGNGQLVAVEIPALQPFSSLHIEGIPGGNGSILIVAGETAAVSVISDDNLKSLFKIDQQNGTLSITMPGNSNNRMWIEDTHIQITVKTPELNSLRLDCNMDTEVRGISATAFTLRKAGNGNLKITGKAEKLNVDKTGNGDVDTKDLVVSSATVKSSGNGNVSVNATESLQTQRTGNGDIIQSGKGVISTGLNMGNGKTVSEADRQKEQPVTEFVTVTLVNKALIKRAFTVRGPEGLSFSYGIEIGPKGRFSEAFPVGTLIQNAAGTTIYTITKADDGKDGKTVVRL